jgi:hypothetical protein
VPSDVLVIFIMKGLNIMKKKKIQKVLSKIQNGEISRDQLNEIINEHPELKDVIESVSPDNEWRRHPTYPHIETSSTGLIKISGEIVKPRVWDGLLKITLQWSKKTLYAALIILQCWEPCPGDMIHYTVGYIDGDPSNLKPSNLYWKKR